MKYSSWIWRNTQGIRLNTAVRILTGTAQVAMGLLMVWLSRRFIDETIHTGSAHDVTVMIIWLVLTVVGGVLRRSATSGLFPAHHQGKHPPDQRHPPAYVQRTVPPPAL